MLVALTCNYVSVSAEETDYVVGIDTTAVTNSVDARFVWAIRHQQYDSCLRLIDAGAQYADYPYLCDSCHGDYWSLMVYADSIKYPSIDSLIITELWVLQDCSVECVNNGAYEDAIGGLEMIIDFAKYLTPPNKSKVMWAYNDIGECYFHLKQYNNALAYADSAITMAHKINIEDSLTLATLSYNIARCCYSLEQYSKSKYYLDEACMYVQTLSDSMYVKQDVLNQMTLLLCRMGKYTEAQPYAEDVLRIAEEYNLITASTYLNNLCLVYGSSGQYEKAIEYSERGLTNECNSDISYMYLLNNIGQCYFKLNNYEKALAYTEAAYDIYQSLEESEQYVFILANLAYIYTYVDIQKAEEYYKMTLGKVSHDNSMYPTILNNMAILYQSMGRSEDAKQCIEESIHTSEYSDRLIRQSNLFFSIANSAFVYMCQGEFKKAITHFDKAMKIAQKIDTEPATMALVKECIAFLYSLQNGKEKKAFLLYQEVLANYSELMATQFDFLTARERALFWEKGNFMRMSVPAFVYAHHREHPFFSTLVYDCALQSKGMLLQASSALTHILSTTSDSILLSQWKELENLRQTIASPETDMNKFTLDSLEYEAESVESWLMKNSKQYRDNQALWRAKWQDVQNKLSDNEAAIEFVCFSPYDENGFANVKQYVALLLKKGWKQPLMFSVCNEEDIRQLMKNPDVAYSPSNNESYRLLWEHLAVFIVPHTKVYFSPDGLLYQFNLEAISIPSGKLLSEEYDLVRLSSTRELVMDNSKITPQTAVLYGGLQYSMDVEDMLAQSQSYEKTTLLACRGDDEERAGFRPLPGTKKEVETIVKDLRAEGIHSDFYTADMGNEESFKALSGKEVNILHIATHGFFHQKEETPQKDLYKLFAISMDDNAPVDDPLLRSGLMLSGANLAYQGHRDEIPTGVQDGVLFSKEIASLNLTSVDLLVLSACQTGQGDINSDGVFGLQRAFKQAGVKTIIMSLWKVNDTATQLFMTEFYRNWITLKQSKREAFTNARNAVRYAVDEDGDRMFEAPEYWAGFIMLD